MLCLLQAHTSDPTSIRSHVSNQRRIPNSSGLPANKAWPARHRWRHARSQLGIYENILLDGDAAVHAGALMRLAVERVLARLGELGGHLLPRRVQVVLVADCIGAHARLFKRRYTTYLNTRLVQWWHPGTHKNNQRAIQRS